MSLYRELDITPQASKDEIKKAYYKLVTKYHPDKNPDGEEKFLKITDAYKILSNDRERNLYDKTLRGTTPEIINNPDLYTAEHDFIRFTDKNPEVDLKRLMLFRFRKARYRFYRRLVAGIVIVASLHAAYSVHSQNSLKQIENAYAKNVEQQMMAIDDGPSRAAAYVDLKERQRLVRMYEESQKQKLRDLEVKYAARKDSL